MGGKTVAVVKSALLARQIPTGDSKQKTGHDRPNNLGSPTHATAEIAQPDAKIVTVIDGTNGQHHDVTIPGPSPSFAKAR